MTKVAGKRGLVISKRPSEYEMTEHQKMFKRIAEACGIKKGISKAELQTAMVECVPKEWEKIREEQRNNLLE